MREEGVRMYLQTHTSLGPVCTGLKMQAAPGTSRHPLIAFVLTMLLFASMMTGALAGAQMAPTVLPVTQARQAAMVDVDPIDSIHQASINPDATNTEGSPASGEVSSIGSVPPAEVNRFESSSAPVEMLPEAPSAIVQDRPLQAFTPEVTRVALPGARVAPLYWKHIPAGWTAQPLTPGDKMVLGMRSLYSPFSLLGYVVTAGYEQAENGQPNFGTDRGAFAQRLGAISLRDTTEDVFTDIVFAPLLHEDPRYYVDGPEHNLLHRVLYAITRPIITRTDSGRDTVNGAELLGYGSASALSYTYYPKINQNFHDTAATFGGSLLGSALGDLVSEFSGQFLQAIHLKKTQ
jgi:hypothetical protein